MQGGMASHAAIVSREIGIVCVTNYQNAERFKTGDRIHIEAGIGKKPVIKKLTRPDDKKNAAETGFSGNRVDEEFSKAAKGGTDAIDHIYEALRLLSKVGVFKEDDKGYPAADRVNDIETAIAAIKAVRPELEERKNRETSMQRKP